MPVVGGVIHVETEPEEIGPFFVFREVVPQARAGTTFDIIKRNLILELARATHVPFPEDPNAPKVRR